MSGVRTLNQMELREENPDADADSHQSSAKKEETMTEEIVKQIKNILYLLVSICCLCDLVVILVLTIIACLKALLQLFFPPPLKSLVGERILITGASKGIGREICLELSTLGATLICWDIDEAANEVLREDLAHLRTKLYIYHVDISVRTQVEDALANVRKEVGPVTMVINNAGIMPVHSFLSHNPKEVERIFQVNVMGQLWILRKVLPWMIASGRGHVVTICSAAGVIGTRNIVPYCSSKHAVHGYVEALKDEMRHIPQKPDIKFTTVYPFSCKTGLTQGVKCFSRFPLLLPILEPAYVARKIVEGTRRNYEHIYLPPIIQLFALLNSILPQKVLWIAADYFDGHVEPELAPSCDDKTL